MHDPEWDCLLKVFNCFPVVDGNFYGSSIFSHKRELKQLGVKVEFEEAVEAFIHKFQQRASSSGISKTAALSFLSCYRQLTKQARKLPSELKICLRKAKWLHTRLGDYRSPKDCILFGPEWESISPITLLPFVDDSDGCYGKDIYHYQAELKSIGVVTDYKSGVKFVVDKLYFPQNLSRITSANVISLLDCIRIFCNEKQPLPESFMEKASKDWLKTHVGYRSPNKCCLFNSEWESHLKKTDGLFLDENFYGPVINLYREELSVIGVTVDAEKGCSLLADHLHSQSNIAIITRIYNFLWAHKWKPDDEAAYWIWIPNGNENGKWVNPDECVLHDKDNLFSSRLNVLDRLYRSDILSFFSSAFSVRSNPSLDDYCKLWKIWESSRQELTHAECCAFWGMMVKCRSSKMEKIIADHLVKLPVISDSGKILLFDKDDVFIADDLQLKEIFETSSPNPIFLKPINISYSLCLSSAKTVIAKASAIIRWDRERSMMFVQELDMSTTKKSLIEYATHYGKAIAEGILWEKEDQISELSELIKLAFLLHFDEEAVMFLLKTKNLQTLMEDDEFLSIAFPSS